MRVFLDVPPLLQPSGGIVRYGKELAQALALLTPDITVQMAADFTSERKVGPVAFWQSKLARRACRLQVALTHWASLPEDRFFAGSDIFHATDHLLPHFSRLRSVFTLHDLSFLHFPRTHTALNRWYLTLMMPHFLKKADRIIAVSEATKKDAVRFCGVKEETVRVIHEGVSASFQPASAQAIIECRRKYRLPERFILFVGTIEPRKNLEALLDAHELLKRRSCQGLEPEGVTNRHRTSPPERMALVIAGPKGWLGSDCTRRLGDLQRQGDVTLLGLVDDDDLPALYSTAELFAYPSLYEGFGLPPLEAMACGTPVVCSRTSSLPEVVGDAALVVPPSDEEALASAIWEVLLNQELRQQMREQGLRQAALFSWDKAARETLSVYRELVD
jgi:glycosyltransferase involved in cell wall biosynthesis